MPGMPLRPGLPRARSGPADTRPKPNINAPVDPYELARRLEVARLENVAAQLRRRSRSSHQLDASKPQTSGVRFEISSQEVRAENVSIQHKQHALAALPYTTGHSRQVSRPKSVAKAKPPRLDLLSPEALVQELDAFQRKDMQSPQITPMVSDFPPTLKSQKSTESVRKKEKRPPPPFLLPSSHSGPVHTLDGELSPQPATLGMFPVAASGSGSSIRRPRSAPLESVPISDFSRLHLINPPTPSADAPIIRRGSRDRPTSQYSRPSSQPRSRPLSQHAKKTAPATTSSRRRSMHDLLNLSFSTAPANRQPPPRTSSRSPARPSTAPHHNPPRPSRQSLERMTPESLALLEEQERRLTDLRRRQERAGRKYAQHASKGSDAPSLTLSMLGDETSGMTKASLRLLKEKENTLRGKGPGAEMVAVSSADGLQDKMREKVEMEKAMPWLEKQPRKRNCLLFWRR